jgi:ABC-type multidrug transport system ATPase subunit/ABC-type multidrug transport system permease subunit
VRAELRTGSEIRIGSCRLTFDGTGFRARDARCDARLDARDLAVSAGGRTIVQPTSLSVEPGELVAVIGRSGSGKTTLVKALAGVIEPSSGAVTLAGDPLGDRLTDVGYVPQDEIVHPLLTVREALRYAARLRLPLDLDAGEVEIVVRRVLEELALEHRADHRIATLSGGERKRAGVAVELLGRPSVLFLDEPTTGLDPSLEARTMRLLRDLADGDRAVVVVTHATRSLELCDRLAIVGPGGRLAFFGPPAEALAHFGVEHHDDLYEAVEAATGEAAVAPAPTPAAAAAATPPPPAARRGSWAAQAGVLTRRYARLLVRDRRNLAILLGQVPLLGIAIGALFGGDVFDPGRDGNANDAAQVLFLLVTTTFWLGAIAAAREIIKERAVVARERAAGVRLSAYLASKAAVLFALAAAQAGVLAAIVLALRPLHEPPGTYAVVVGVLVAAAVVAVAGGLVISAVARSEDQAASYIPLLLVPQLLFAGAIVPLTKMGAALEALSAVVPSRWAFAALGTAIDMNGRIAVDPTDARRSPYGRDFFATSAPEALAILAAFLVVALGAVAVLVARRRAAAR